jgi:hypothetical protein
MEQKVKINASKIPPLTRHLLGKTFYEAMVEFYENPENVRRFEIWRQEQHQKGGAISIGNAR